MCSPVPHPQESLILHEPLLPLPQSTELSNVPHPKNCLPGACTYFSKQISLKRVYLHMYIYTLYVYIHTYVYVSSVEGHLGCSYFLAIVNKVAMRWAWSNKWLWSRMLSPLGTCQRLVYLVLLADLFLVFWGYSILLSRTSATMCIPITSEWGFLFPHNLASICYQLFYWAQHF